MSEVIKEVCRRILVRHAISDPDGRIGAAMADAFNEGKEVGCELQRTYETEMPSS